MERLLQFEAQLATALDSRAPGILNKALIEARERWASAVFQEAAKQFEYSPSADQVRQVDQIIQQPIFIGGNWRSGTTLISNLIDGHPEVHVLPSETLYFELFEEKLKNTPASNQFELLAKDWVERLADPINFKPNWLLGRSTAAESPYVHFVRVFHFWWEHYHSTVQASDLPVLRAIAAANISLTDAPTPLKCWIEKTPGNEVHYQALARAFPKLKLILLIRHPEQMLHSFKRIKIKSNARVSLNSFYKTDLRYQSLAALEQQANCKVVRYEDLTATKAATLQEVYAFLNVAHYDAQPTIRTIPAQANSSFADEQTRGNSTLTALEVKIIRTLYERSDLDFGYTFSKKPNSLERILIKSLAAVYRLLKR